MGNGECRESSIVNREFLQGDEYHEVREREGLAAPEEPETRNRKPETSSFKKELPSFSRNYIPFLTHYKACL
jgi:hypothetical protein